MFKIIENSQITPLQSRKQWVKEFPEVDREYIWIYPLISSKTFVARNIFKASTHPLLSLDTVIYIHIPACLFSCPMCPFYFEIIKKREELKQYVEALINEIKIYQTHYLSKEICVKTIYFGGGTASLLFPSDIGRIIKQIQQTFNTDANLEITVENHPSVINEDYLKGLFDNGVNRISLGIQSFNDETLQLIRGNQTSAINKQRLNEALRIGFNTVSADMIYRIPNQTVDDVQRELQEFLSFGITSLSAYSLEFNTRKYSLKDRQPNDKIDKEMFYAINRYLTAKKWIHIAQPDYSAPGHIHNETITTWQAPQGQWLSFGAGAWSSFNNNIFCNVHNMKEYITVLKKNELPILGGQPYSIEDAMSRYMVLGTRCFNIPNMPFADKFGISIFDAFHNELTTLRKMELVKLNEIEVRITDKGKYYVDNISKIFYSLNNRNRCQPWGANLKNGVSEKYYTI